MKYLFIFIVGCFMFDDGTCFCGEQNLAEGFGQINYSPYGTNETEICHWTFHLPRDSDGLLMVKFLRLNAPVIGGSAKAYLILPNGEYVYDGKGNGNQCRAYILRRTRRKNCLEDISLDDCTVEEIGRNRSLTISSYSEISIRDRWPGQHQYYLEFHLLYFYTYYKHNETKHNETKHNESEVVTPAPQEPAPQEQMQELHLGFIIASSMAALFFVTSVVLLIILLCKTRNKTDKLVSSGLNETSSPERYNCDDYYEVEMVSNGNATLNQTNQQTKDKQIVDNLLYHSYKEPETN